MPDASPPGHAAQIFGTHYVLRRSMMWQRSTPCCRCRSSRDEPGLCRAAQVSTRHPGLDDLSAQREIIESRDLERFAVRGPG